MKDKTFLDTNIFVYSFDKTDHRKRKLAEGLINAALESQLGVVSTQVVQEFVNVALKKFERPLAVSDCLNYIDTVFTPLCDVFSSMALYKEALSLHQETRYSFYDSLVIAAALEARCTLLYSEDFQNGQKLRELKIVNPFLEEERLSQK